MQALGKRESEEKVMAQYCRYCAFCFEGDGFFCSNKEPTKYLTEAQIKRKNSCKDFALSALGDVITGREYQPREPKPRSDDGNKQLNIFDCK